MFGFGLQEFILGVIVLLLLFAFVVWLVRR